MFDQLFKYKKVIKDHFDAPLLEDRVRYLKFRLEQRTPRTMVEEISNYQLTVIKYLGLKDDNKIITLKRIESAAERWRFDQRGRFQRPSPYASKGLFIKHAKQWLQFLGRLEVPEKPPKPIQITEYANYIRDEKGLAELTIFRSCMQLEIFFSQLKCELGQFLAQCTPTDLDTLQVKVFRQRPYCTNTKGTAISILRTFFRYAERRGWCRTGIADSINAPRFYKHAALPSGPSWEEVQYLLKTTEGNHPYNIRDRAIILMLVVYGLRDSEVRYLRIDDFDWEKGIFYLKHSKRGPQQQFPIVPTVGQALIQYLKEVRPQGLCGLKNYVVPSLWPRGGAKDWTSHN